MDVLIQQYEEQHYQFPGFWKKLDSSYKACGEPEVFSGHLKLKSAPKVWKSRFCKLTSEFLYLHKVYTRQSQTSPPTKLAAIRWKRVDPFTEENDNASEMRFGFRLYRGKNFQDFYTDSADELEIWLDHLAQVSMMSDLENDYAIGDQIGCGAYAQVCVGKAIGDQKTVAIKTIRKEEIAKSERNVMALINEVNLMKKLDHPRVIKLLGMYESEATLHLVLEYASSGDLFQRLIKRGKYSEAKASEFMKKFLEVLDFIHQRGVVHRDLKPENILLVDNFEFKIGDFGLASEYHTGEQLSLRCGSPGYVAPEILEKHKYDTKVDVFSAGVILYIL